MKIHISIISLFMVFSIVSCSFPTAATKPAVATSTSTLTPSETPLPVPTFTPVPSVTPTPMPAIRIENAGRSILLGDYDKTLLEYQAALASSSDAESQAEAMLGAGRVFLTTGQNQPALDTLRSLVEKYPTSKVIARAYYFLGQVYNALQRYPEAAQAYAQYLQLSPGFLDAYVQELRGDALSASQDYANAILAYQEAIKAPHLGSSDWLEIKVGQTEAASHNYKDAITQYETIITQSNNDAVKAQAGLLDGQAYQALGQTQEAYQQWSQIVTHYPRSYEAYSALVTLVDDGIPVSDLDRGLVDYFAGQSSLAVEAFNRYLAAGQSTDGTALHYKALSLQSVGEQKYPPGSTLRDQANAQGGVPEDLAAIAAWEVLINTYPTDRFWSDAWDEIAITQWANMDQPKLSAQTMLDFVTQHPGNDRAAEFLFTAGRYLERAGLLDDAAKTWERLANEYPSAQETFRGLLFAGVTYFRENKLDLAQTDFQRGLLLAVNPEDQAAAELWTGKAEKGQNNLANAQLSWQSAAARDPGGYYSERARQLLLDQAPLTAPDTIDLAVDLPAERKDAQTWLRTAFNLPADTQLDDLGAMSTDPRIIRGNEFWALGLYDEARAEFEDLRNEVTSDPSKTFRLVQFFVDLGLYRSAILASRQVLTLVGMDDAASLNAPIYFNHVRFGVYYKDQVLPLAQADGLNPLLIFSLIRQESFFESFVQSSAGAQGLMQLMPATAQGLVDQSGWPPNYSNQDLYRPVVNLKLGVDYLARQVQGFNGDLYAALAAYNGGPGNTAAWKELAPNDSDLFLETVRIQETRNYIMRIAETFAIYQRLYVRNP